MTFLRIAPLALFALALAACGGRYVAPSQAVSEDIAASHWNGAAGTSSNEVFDFRDNDIGALDLRH